MCICLPKFESNRRVRRLLFVACVVLMPVACYQNSKVSATDTSSLEDSATVEGFETESDVQTDSDTTFDRDSLALECQSEIEFADPNLEALIRQAINKPSGAIFFSDIVSVSHLNFSFVPMGAGSGGTRGSIVDLSGLQCFINLNTLGLRNQQIVDISPLAALTNLEDLDLMTNFIVDIEPLSHLTALKTLSLSDNQIVDISQLTELPDLEWLGLSHNQITDLEPLVSNTALADGTTLVIESNLYDCDSITTQNQISTLENRGVVLYHDCE